MHAIVERVQLSPNVTRLVVEAPRIAEVRRPGQFVIVRRGPGAERIPLTIADADPVAGTITLVIQAVGKTTREMQQTCQVGTSLHALVGPMGIPSHVGNARKVMCVGGGRARLICSGARLRSGATLQRRVQDAGHQPHCLVPQGHDGVAS